MTRTLTHYRYLRLRQRTIDALRKEPNFSMCADHLLDIAADNDMNFFAVADQMLANSELVYTGREPFGSTSSPTYKLAEHLRGNR